MTSLFISDIHVEPARPDITEQLLAFLASEARQAEALYILGDLFETWIGDDDPDPEKHRVVHALHDLTRSGVPCYFMSGNRDFLTGQVFADHTGCGMLDDPAAIELYGEPVLLMHGDTLCTDDLDYQIFRRMVRGEEWQLHFLGKPVHHRLAMAQQARDASMKATGSKPAEIMDVSQETVEAVMRKHGIYTMVHGHTHRPAVHRFQVDGHPATRIVLGDWHEQGSVLRWSPSGFSLDPLPR
ncbi:MAG: UDP-2,3-diacylglucosamine diphosphatase [Gammaproteobacteria bacterium]